MLELTVFTNHVVIVMCNLRRDSCADFPGPNQDVHDRALLYYRLLQYDVDEVSSPFSSPPVFVVSANIACYHREIECWKRCKIAFQVDIPSCLLSEKSSHRHAQNSRLLAWCAFCLSWPKCFRYKSMKPTSYLRLITSGRWNNPSGVISIANIQKEPRRCKLYSTDGIRSRTSR